MGSKSDSNMSRYLPTKLAGQHYLCGYTMLLLVMPAILTVTTDPRDQDLVATAQKKNKKKTHMTLLGFGIYFYICQDALYRLLTRN